MSALPLVLYHASCKDGFAAAWAHHRSGQPAEYLAIQYGTPAPLELLRGRPVIMLDFCFKREEMAQIAQACAHLTVIDHHQTAAEEMGWVPRADGPAERPFAEEYGGTIFFDMKRSGAGLTWDVFHPGQPRPWIVDYVEDRDLWRNALPLSRETNAYISTLAFEFSVWDAIESQRPTEDFLNTYGRAAMAKTQQYIREVSKNACRVRFEGYDVPIVNAPQFDISELLNYLATDEPFAMGWWQLADRRFKYSLRVKNSGIDVSRFAQKWGGGGHPSAAGFEADSPIHLTW